MKVVATPLLALLAFASSDALATGKENPSFLAGAAGTYQLVSGNCSAREARLEYEAESRTLHVNREPLNDGYTSWMSFHRINRRRDRRGSDFFRWTDERSVLEGGRLRNMERGCSGLIIVNCGKWKTIAGLQFAAGDDGTRLFVDRADRRETRCAYFRPKR